jgi:hypothetical protein
MTHPESQTLSDYLDGDLSPLEVGRLETHLEECASCSDLLRELSEVQQVARTLPERLPERDLWPGISEAILGEGLQHSKVIELHPWRQRPSEKRGRRGFRLSYLQAAAAGVILALFSGAAGALLYGPQPVSIAVPAPGPSPWVELVSQVSPELGDAAREVAQMEGLLAQHSDRMEEETVRILEKNLGIIDQAIRESVRALQSDPGNPFLEKHLARSVESKAAYLREATAFVAPVS